MIDQISLCRGCVSTEVDDVLKLQPVPIGDSFSVNANNALTYPIGLALCAQCGLVQLSHRVESTIVFERYFSESFPLTEDLVLDRVRIPRLQHFLHSLNVKTLLSVGSGSGRSLERYHAEGITVIGIEPSDRQANVSRNLGIDTLTGYLTETVVEEILSKYGQVDMVLVDNFTKMPHPAHISNVEDPLAYAENLSRLIKPNGCVYLRVPYIGSILAFGLVDYVYHEHQSYFSYRSIKQLFSRVGLHIKSSSLCENNSMHAELLLSSVSKSLRGGDVRTEFEKKENGLKIHKKKTFSDIADALNASKAMVRQEFGDSCGLRIAGYGASTATVAMMYQYELVSDLDFLVDDNKDKIGLYSPNANLRVENVDKIYTSNVDVLVILASRFANKIKEDHRKFSGKVVVPSLDLD